jgi:uncharacterized membrane protein
VTRHDDDTYETLVGISFADLFRAQEFLTAASRLNASKHLVLKDAVIVVKNENGNSVVRETIDPQPARSALSGAVWTGLLGLLLAGPVGWLAGTAVGAGAGAVTAKVMDYGIPDEWVTWFREAVQPGTATVALLVTELDRNALIAEVERFQGAHLVYANLDDVTLDRIRGALGEAVLTTPAEATDADEPPAPPAPPTPGPAH